MGKELMNIDVVIPWVDGNDIDWIEKKSKYMTGQSIDNNEMTSNNRYEDYGTLKYVLRSIDINMPWANKVFLLTDGQKPEWINSSYVKVIDHKEFIKGTLPTFNSNVIMTNLQNIPGLSEYFILMNDDLFLWSQSDVSDYFVDHLPVDAIIETGTVPSMDGFFHISQNGVALMNASFDKHKLIRKKFTKFFNIKYGVNQLRTALSIPYGGFIGFYNPHFPIAYRKKDFIEFKKNPLNEKAIELTNRHRFRKTTDINDWAVRYYRNLLGNFTQGRLLNGDFKTISDFKKEISIDKNKKILVINDDGCRESEALARVKDILNAKFGEKSKYEI